MPYQFALEGGGQRLRLSAEDEAWPQGRDRSARRGRSPKAREEKTEEREERELAERIARDYIVNNRIGICRFLGAREILEVRRLHG